MSRSSGFFVMVGASPRFSTDCYGTIKNGHAAVGGPQIPDRLNCGRSFLDAPHSRDSRSLID